MNVERDLKNKRQTEHIEWAVEFSSNKFQTTLEKVQKDHLPPTHALVFWYCSLLEAEAAILSGIPALLLEVPGVVVTLHRPHELDKLDLATFTNREAVLACAVPWHLLKPLEPRDSVEKEYQIVARSSSSSPSSALCVLSADMLMALRGSCLTLGT